MISQMEGPIELIKMGGCTNPNICRECVLHEYCQRYVNNPYLYTMDDLKKQASKILEDNCTAEEIFEILL